EGGVDDEDERRLELGAVEKDDEWEEGDRGDRSQELDGRGGEVPQEGDAADDDPDRDTEDHRDGEADRPAAQGVRDRSPEGALAELLDDGREELAGRGEEASVQRPDARQDLEQGTDREEPEDPESRSAPGEAAAPPLRGSCDRRHGSRTSRSGTAEFRPSPTASSASSWTVSRLISPGQRGRTAASATAGSMLV